MAGTERKRSFYFKTIVAALVVMIALLGFVGCGKDDPAGDPGANNNASVPRTEEQNKGPETDNTEKEPVAFNQNLFSDMGSSYKDVSGKYGKLSESNYLDGAYYYLFEGSNAMYFFMDEEGDSTSSVPNDENLCFCMDTNAGTLFDNFGTEQKVKDVEQAIGVKMEVTKSEMTESYFCDFEYEGLDVLIDMGDSDSVISSSSWVRVFHQELRQKMF